MIFQILNKGNLVKVVKNYSNVVNYFNRVHPNLKGFSKRTLIRRLKDNNIYEKGDFTIFRQKPDELRRKIFKEITNTELEERPLERTYKFKKRFVINEITYLDILQYIINILNNYPENIRNNRKFQIIFVINENNREEYFYNSTKFGNLNETRNRVFNKLLEIIENYGVDQKEVKEIKIRISPQMFGPQFEDVIVYGTIIKNVKFIKEYLRNVLESNISSKNVIDKTKNILRNYSLISPSTRRNCFIESYYLCKNKNRNFKESRRLTKELIRKYKISKEDRTIGNLTRFLSEVEQTNINVINLTDFRKFSINKENYKDNDINILVFGSHSYALIDNKYKIGCDVTDKNFKDNNFKLKACRSKRIRKIPLKKKEFFRICTYDLETCDKKNHKLTRNKTNIYAIGFYDGNKYINFYGYDYDKPVKEFIIFLLWACKHDDMIIYAHNGGKFDTWLIFKELIKSYGTVTNIVIKNGRIINLKYQYKDKTIFFRDSIPFLLGSLDKLCKDFKTKTKKLIDDVDHDKININNCNTKEIKEYTQQYLKNDCVCLYELLLSFDRIIKRELTSNKFGIKEVLTNASLAREIFLEFFYDQDDPIYNINVDYDSKLREFYYGGRNEVFTKLGKTEGKLYYYDFTSLYPYCLLNKLPYGTYTLLPFVNELYPKRVYINDNTKESLYNYWFGFVECEVIHLKKNKRPFHAYKKDGKLLFPYFDNYKRIIITTEELKYSLKNKLGYQYKILNVYHYNYRSKYYKNMINHLYKLKIDAEINNNPALRQIAKIIINSSYGFWGIKRNIESVDVFRPKGENKQQRILKKLNDYLESGLLKDYEHNKKNNYNFFKYEETKDINCSNISIAFFACAYARTKLYDLMNDIDKRKGNIYYCDTDSIITDFCIENNRELKRKYLTPKGKKNRLGDLTNETGEYGGYYKKLITLGNKIYYLENDDLKDKKRILKFKGLNVNKGYEKRIIDKKNKEIKYINLKKDGDKKLSVDDYELLDKHYKLSCESMTFNSGTDIIYKNKEVEKLINNKSFKKAYYKGNVDNNDKIKPYSI